MNSKSISKYISLILRHKPEVAGVTLDEHGWAKVNDLVAGVKKKYPDFGKAQLYLIVMNDEKQRYSFNDSMTRIRANQGHSIEVDVELEEVEPTGYLWHGSGAKYFESICKNGLIPKSRLYVHLSSDIDTAEAVGKRHGEPVIFSVDACQMYRDGYKFYRSKNGVWLTKEVPKKYLQWEDL